jgi:hypothetical protein
LVDLDGDGHADILSGSWPGEVYFFRRNSDGTFTAGEQLKDKEGKPIHVGHASAAFAADWDGNGTLDLIVGTVSGEVTLVPNEGSGKELKFGTPRRLQTDGQPIKVNGDAAPVVADWDGDGKHDLIVGTADGSVVWFRNSGAGKEPQLEAARTLVAKSTLAWDNDDKRRPGQWGLRVKPCVVDWDGDGRLDLLLGDRCGGFQAKPNQTEQEKAEERQANDKLPELRRQWAAVYRDYRRLSDAAAGGADALSKDQARALDVARTELQRLKDEIVVVQEIQRRYVPGYQTHGFVWLFRRLPGQGASQ